MPSRAFKTNRIHWPVCTARHSTIFVRWRVAGDHFSLGDTSETAFICHNFHQATSKWTQANSKIFRITQIWSLSRYTARDLFRNCLQLDLEYNRSFTPLISFDLSTLLQGVRSFYIVFHWRFLDKFYYCVLYVFLRLTATGQIGHQQFGKSQHLKEKHNI